MSYKGKYTPQNISKYKGNWRNIVHRSMWERQIMKYLDENESVLEWSSEELIIPYTHPVDGRRHRYFPDFWLKVRKSDGTITEHLWEVKPYKQTLQPTLTEEATRAQKRRFAMDIKTFAINNAKWSAAREICEQKGWTFSLITEKQLSSMVNKK